MNSSIALNASAVVSLIGESGSGLALGNPVVVGPSGEGSFADGEHSDGSFAAQTFTAPLIKNDSFAL